MVRPTVRTALLSSNVPPPSATRVPPAPLRVCNRTFAMPSSAAELSVAMRVPDLGGRIELRYDWEAQQED